MGDGAEEEAEAGVEDAPVEKLRRREIETGQ